MPNITVRNIPEDLLDKLRTLSEIERRSLNSEILIALERGVESEYKSVEEGFYRIPRDIQVAVWEKLCGKWQDSRTTEEIIDDVLSTRSEGRDVDL